MILKLHTICAMMMRHCTDRRWTFDDDDDHAHGKEMSQDDDDEGEGEGNIDADDGDNDSDEVVMTVAQQTHHLLMPNIIR